MKVMQINCVYQNGSTGKIVYDIHTYLQKQGHRSVVCYGRGETIREEAVYKTCGEQEARFNKLGVRMTGVKFGGCFFSTNRLLRTIKKENPDIVHLQCINGYFVNIFRLVTYLKKRHIKTVLTLHAEFMYTATCGYALDCEKWKSGCGHCSRAKAETHTFCIDGTATAWKRMKTAFDGFDDLRVVSVSPWVQSRAQQSPFLCDKQHLTILNGIDTAVFCHRTDENMRDMLGLQNKKVVFHVTSAFSNRKDHIKGGAYVLEMARRFLKIDPDVVFVVAGSYGELENVPPNVMLMGNVADQQTLAACYSMADVTLLTSQKETFSMVVAESMCCGTPVVGFEAGAPEMIAIDAFSTFVAHGDSQRLFEELKRWLYGNRPDQQYLSQVAQQKYSKSVMGQRYLALYLEMMESSAI